MIVLFSKLLLGKSQSFEEFGAPQLFPALSLLVAWIIVGACIIRGVKSSGKVCLSSLKYFSLENDVCLGGIFYSYFPIHCSIDTDYSKFIIEGSCRWN